MRMPPPIHRGEAHPLARLTEEDVRELRTRYAAGNETVEEIALDYDMSVSTIGDAIRGASWKHVQ